MFIRDEKDNLPNFSLSSIDYPRVKELEAGYTLFSSIFEPHAETKIISQSSKNLAALAYAFSQSHISVNGQPADKRYPIAAYFTSGGRILFDLSDLTIKQQNEYWKLLFPNEKNLLFRVSSHRISGVTATGNPAEISLKPISEVTATKNPADISLKSKKNILKHPLYTLLSLYNILSQVFTRSQSGMNIAIGGEGTLIEDNTGILKDEKGNEARVANDGRNGHVLISTSRGFFHSWFHWIPGSSYFLSRTGNAFMVGIENSASGKKNIRTNNKHSPLAQGNELSPFKLPKIGSRELAALEEKKGLTLSGINNGYNVFTAKVTEETLDALREAQTNLRNTNDLSFIQKVVNLHPKKAIHVKNAITRIEKMQKYQDFTNKTSNTLKWGTFGALCLAGLGIGLCFIPGLQPVGAVLAYFGLKTTISLSATLSIACSISGITGACLGIALHKSKQYLERKNYKKSIESGHQHSQSREPQLGKRPSQATSYESGHQHSQSREPQLGKHPSRTISHQSIRRPTKIITSYSESQEMDSPSSILSILTAENSAKSMSNSAKDNRSPKTAPISDEKIIVSNLLSPTRTPTDLTTSHSFSTQDTRSSCTESDLPHVSSQHAIHVPTEPDVSYVPSQPSQFTCS